ncbi:hypothetical protein ACXR0O_10755 [Verrucomicrobiota bacterium sgz303538]
MLKLFKKLLGKSEAPVAVPRPVVKAVPKVVTENPHPMPQIEVAHLSLAAIMQKLPDDLRKSIVRMPDESVTVALPLATIQKQLPTGSVKMSLASLYRQAPAGTFNQARTEDRRMVDIPLPEIFKHVNPQLLSRREQRRVELPEDSVALFGDSANPYAIAPAVPDEPAPVAAPAPSPAARVPRVIQPPKEMQPSVTSRPGNASRPSSAPGMHVPPNSPRATPRAITPPSGFSAPAQAATEDSNASPLTLPLAPLASDWPEPIRSEAFALADATVSLPTGAVTSGLARGKVVFTWGQLRSWITPPPVAPTEAREATELVLPLKVIAPAFLAHSKPKAPRRGIEIDETIPALFSGGTPEEAPAPTPVTEPAAVSTPSVEQEPAEPVAEPTPPRPTLLTPPVELRTEAPVEPAPDPQAETEEPAPAIPAPVELAAEQQEEPKDEIAVSPENSTPTAEPEAVPAVEAPAAEQEPAAPVEEPAPSQPTLLAPPVEFQAEAPVESSPEPVAEAEAPAPATSAPVELAIKPKQTLGEIFGNPEKTHWSPPELVKATAALPSIAGAVIGLQEGLLVAADLPDSVKGDTVAAFLPQIFARLTNYAGEMKLGAVENILFTANGSPFQIFRLGEVYFAVLGKPGETLPWENLRLIAEELAHHHQK